jgi:hypothetical protein
MSRIIFCEDCSFEMDPYYRCRCTSDSFGSNHMKGTSTIREPFQFRDVELDKSHRSDRHSSLLNSNEILKRDN